MKAVMISIKGRAGSFAENKDVARNIRVKQILPAMEKNKTIIIDFSDVTGVTQSFMHALISDAIRLYGEGVLDRIKFKNCSPLVKEVITIVSDYMQES